MIWQGAFANCSALKNIVLSEDMTVIGNYAFYNSGLESATIKVNVHTIGKGAFGSITIYGEKGSYAEEYAALNSCTFEEINTDTTVSATGVTLNKSAISLEEGKTEKLIATITPQNATNNTIIWSSSNSNIASVSSGVVTAKSAGTATITATTADGGYTANCIVTVTKASTDDGEQGGEDIGGEEEIPDDWIDSGTDANGIDWYFYESGLLKIVGTGAMEDYAKTSDIPWYGEKANITEIVISGGITHIGDRSFYNCIEALKADIPASVTSIGSYAFRNCELLTIYGESGSYAQTYASANNIPFKSTTKELLKTIAYELTESSTKYIFDITSDDITEDAVAYVALYDNDGNMLAAETEEFIAGDITSLIIAKNSLAKTAKIFVWNTSSKPISYSQTHNF